MVFVNSPTFKYKNYLGARRHYNSCRRSRLEDFLANHVRQRKHNIRQPFLWSSCAAPQTHHIGCRVIDSFCIDFQILSMMSILGQKRENRYYLQQQCLRNFVQEFSQRNEQYALER